MGLTDRSRDERVRQAAAAAARYGESGEERREAERRQSAGIGFPDSPEALATRTARLLERQAVPAAMMVEAIRSEPLAAPDAFERILGVSKELQAWSFLPRGARAARTVARIAARENGRELPVGTGFLVSPRLMMTNHHVLPDAGAARGCFAEFDAQVTVDNTPQAPLRLEFHPDAFFVADKRLDYALVAVSPGPDGKPPGETFGWNRLSAQLGKLVIGEPVNVIGHPMGRLKEIAVRDNALQVRLDDFIHYRTDTEPGNSGSPVFNDQWEVVALHHSGVPRTDDQGRLLRRDGQIWKPGDGEDAVDWVSNEGARISVVLTHLASLPLTPAQRELLTGMGPETGLAGVQPADATADALAGPVPATAEVTGVSSAGDSGPAAALTGRASAEAAVKRPRGVRARDGAFGGGRHLVFLHGRAQQGKDPEALRREWAAGLNWAWSGRDCRRWPRRTSASRSTATGWRTPWTRASPSPLPPGRRRPPSPALPGPARCTRRSSARPPRGGTRRPAPGRGWRPPRDWGRTRWSPPCGAAWAGWPPAATSTHGPSPGSSGTSPPTSTTGTSARRS
ncbi:serine protease [Streptomyces sp. ZS0098]|uniref:trypsin-like serine peptidase n=1 Tax=Streptomyces sp. ZS0098 TaxID=1904044 RepID=UPI00287B8CD3|nr:serine protease [Streptomyces sp. ZS0098]